MSALFVVAVVNAAPPFAYPFILLTPRLISIALSGPRAPLGGSQLVGIEACPASRSSVYTSVVGLPDSLLTHSPRRLWRRPPVHILVLGFVGLLPRLPIRPFRLSGPYSLAERPRVARSILPPLASPVIGLVPVLPLPRRPASLSLRDFLSRGRFFGLSRSPDTDVRDSPLILGRLFRVHPACILLRLGPDNAGCQPRCLPRPVPFHPFPAGPHPIHGVRGFPSQQLPFLPVRDVLPSHLIRHGFIELLVRPRLLHLDRHLYMPPLPRG
mmetsp:Transcript_16267/g.39987  ORF Transcript_16267/g.39987 Transcript_16267/m.39987 type:complete len:269 (-) Transcript_16267:778-1584(-)